MALTDQHNGHHGGLLRVTWMTALFWAAFVLLALTTVSVALFAQIHATETSDRNADRNAAQAEEATRQAEEANFRVERLRDVGDCRAAYAQLVDMALLTGSGSLLAVLDDISRQGQPGGPQPLSEARTAVANAIEQRRASAELCERDPSARPDFSMVGGAP